MHEHSEQHKKGSLEGPRHPVIDRMLALEAQLAEARQPLRPKSLSIMLLLVVTFVLSALTDVARSDVTVSTVLMLIFAGLVGAVVARDVIKAKRRQAELQRELNLLLGDTPLRPFSPPD